jgi:hypothetical protein
MRMLGRIDGDDSVRVEEVRIPLAEDLQRYFILVGQIGSSVRQGVGELLVGNVDDRTHTLTRLRIPPALSSNAGFLPEGFLLLVGPGIISPGDEVDPGFRDCDQGFSGISGTTNDCGILCWPYDDEVVVHDIPSVYAMPSGHERIFSRPAVDENHIAIPHLPDL